VEALPAKDEVLRRATTDAVHARLLAFLQGSHFEAHAEHPSAALGASPEPLIGLDSWDSRDSQVAGGEGGTRLHFTDTQQCQALGASLCERFVADLSAKFNEEDGVDPQVRGRSERPAHRCPEDRCSRLASPPISVRRPRSLSDPWAAPGASAQSPERRPLLDQILQRAAPKIPKGAEAPSSGPANLPRAARSMVRRSRR